MQTHNTSIPPAPNNTNAINKTSISQRRNVSKLTGTLYRIATLPILAILFILTEIIIYRQGMYYLSTLKNEMQEWKHRYKTSLTRLNRSKKMLGKEKNLWQERLLNVREGVKELERVHEGREGYWKNLFGKVSNDFDVEVMGPASPPEVVEDDQTSDYPEEETATANTNTNTNTKKENKNEKKLNIVLLYADDWRYDTFGAAGNSILQTPNLDRMAKDGMMFTHNCVTTSICWISRGTLQTGQYLARHKSPKMSEPNFVTDGWNETYNYLLKEVGGYYTGFIGKWHYQPFPSEKFDVAKEYYGWHMDPSGTRHITQENEKDGLEFLRTRPPNKPFALTVSFFATHAVDANPAQFIPQNKSMHLYKNVEIPTADSVSEESWKRLPHFFTDYNEGRERWKWRFDTPEKYQHMMKNYYRMATEVDTACGNIIKELERQGVLNDTLIIFTTDNGYFHGEHGLADKWYPHQESIRVPLVILDPRIDKSKKGKINDDFTLNIDLAPTMLSAAGITPPDSMQGRDISELYTSTTTTTTNQAWRHEFFYEHPSINDQEDWIPTSEALVRKDYKYIIWPYHKMEQLFDLINDPLEENDLANNGIMTEEHKYILDEMRIRFKVLKEDAK